MNALQAFGIQIEAADITVGPLVTRFEFIPGRGVRLDRILRLERELQRAVAADHLRIRAPLPRKDTVAVDVRRQPTRAISLAELLVREEFHSASNRLPIALGLGVCGDLMIVDLCVAPHLLVTGSITGQSTPVLTAALISWLYRFTPEDLRLIIISTEGLELSEFGVLPHLVVPVVTNVKKALLALRWVESEIEKRFRYFAQCEVRDFSRFNARGMGGQASPSGTGPFETLPERVPYVVVVIAEYAPLSETASEFESLIERLSRRGPAAGIHLVLSTSSIRKEVLTDTIRSSLPTRVARAVENSKESRLILGGEGAEALAASDALVLRTGTPMGAETVHLTTPSEHEVQRIVSFCASQWSGILELEPVSSSSEETVDISEEDDTLLQQCIEVVRQERMASASLFQRRLRLGYTKAARLLDLLELRGYIGPGKGAQPRAILRDS